MYYEKIFCCLLTITLTSNLCYIIFPQLFQHLESKTAYFSIYYIIITIIILHISLCIGTILYPFPHIIFMQNTRFFRFLHILLMIWLAGCLLRITHFILEFKKLHRLSRTNIPIEDLSVHHLYHQLCVQASLKHRPVLYQNEQVLQPLLYGCLPTKIILPYCSYTPLQFQVLLTHELYHYKHHDLFWRNCMNVLSVLFWFEPFVWYLRKELFRWQEVLCDIHCCQQNPFHFSFHDYFGAILDSMEIILHKFYVWVQSPTETPILLDERITKTASYPTCVKPSKLVQTAKAFILISCVFTFIVILLIVLL